MSNLVFLVSQAINCYKTHPQSSTAQELEQVFTKFLELLELAYRHNQAQAELAQVIELVKTAINELTLGNFWQYETKKQGGIVGFNSNSTENPQILDALFSNCVNF